MKQFKEDLEKFGLRDNYSEKELKTAYHALAKKYHPDMFMHLSLSERTKKENEFKEISNAYNRLKERLEKIKNGNKSDFDFNFSFDDLVNRAVNDGDIEGCYTLYFLFADREILTKLDMKKELKTVMPEELYATLCLQAEKKNLRQVHYKNSELIRRKLNNDYTEGKCVLPLITNIVTKMLEKIEELCHTKGYTYELLNELDRISIEYIDYLFSEYRKHKFNAEHSFGYKILISLYDSKWEECKDMIHSLPFDCNFSDLLREYCKITYLVDNVLEEMLLEKRKQVAKEYDAKISGKENSNSQISEEELTRLYWEARKVLDEIDYYYLLNYAYNNDTYIDKDIIEQKLEEAIAKYSNGIEERKGEYKSMQKNMVLSAIDKKLDSFPKIQEYYPELLPTCVSRFAMLNNDASKQKVINELLQQASHIDENDPNYRLIQDYINYPDFIPHYIVKTKNNNEYSILNCILAADYYERYVGIDSKTLKKLYNTVHLDTSTKSKLGSSLFLERRYNKSDYFLAFRTRQLVIGSSQVRVKEPEIVEIKRKTYQAVLEKYVSFFKRTELREPSNEDMSLFVELAMSMTFDLEQETKDIDINSMTLQDIIKLHRELKNKLFHQKTDWILDLSQFSMSMNSISWGQYNGQMIDMFGINLLPPLIFFKGSIHYINDEFWKSVLSDDSLKVGICYFDNRWLYTTGETMPLTEQQIYYSDASNEVLRAKENFQKTKHYHQA